MSGSRATYCIRKYLLSLLDPNTPDVELYERYVHSTVPVPDPCIVEDPMLPVPSESMRNNDATNPTISHPILATAIM